MKRKYLILILLFLFLISFVSAYEMETGDIMAGTTFYSYDYRSLYGSGGLHACLTQLNVINIEYTAGTSALIFFDVTDAEHAHYANGAPNYAEAPFTAILDGLTIGTGTFGYQRRYDLLGNEIAGYQYLLFSSWNIVGLSGDKDVTIDFDRALAPFAAMSGASSAGWDTTPPIGYFTCGGTQISRSYITYNKHFQMINSYLVTKGLGLGIVGHIYKHGIDDPIIYNSRAFIINASNEAIVTSEPALSGDYFDFNIPTESIYIALEDTNGEFHNSSIFFTVSNPVEAPNAYGLTVSPNTINYGSLTNVILSSLVGYDSINLVSFYTQDTANYEVYTMFRSYLRDGAGWLRTNTSNTPYVSTSDNPFNFIYYPETIGDKIITVQIYNKTGSYPIQYERAIGTASTILHVQSSVYNPLVRIYLFALDVYTGAHLSNVSLTLVDYTAGGVSRTWVNDLNYQELAVLNAYDYCSLTGVKEGYTTNSIYFNVPLATGNLDNPNNPPQLNQFVGVQLTSSGINPNPNNFTLVITAIDSVTKEPIPNFKISIIPLNILQTADSSGNQMIILVPYDIVFSVTASATGYQSQTDNTGSYHPLTLRKIEFSLVKITPTPTKTTIISTYTTRPTITETEGGIIKNATFCENPTDLSSALDYFFCVNGISKASTGIILACIIMMVFSCILGILSMHSLGFLVGALIGFILSIGLGLIPFWILLGLLGLGILLGILMLTKGGGS